MAESKMGVVIKSCEECENMNCARRIMRTLQFRHSNGNVALDYEINFRSALAYDDEKNEILINEDLLMQAIMLANPGQKRRGLRLISADEFEEITSPGRIYNIKWIEEMKKEEMKEDRSTVS